MATTGITPTIDKLDLTDDMLLNMCNCNTFGEYNAFVEACLKIHGLDDTQVIVAAMRECGQSTEFIEEMLEKCEHNIIFFILCRHISYF